MSLLGSRRRNFTGPVIESQTLEHANFRKTPRFRSSWLHLERNFTYISQIKNHKSQTTYNKSHITDHIYHRSLPGPLLVTVDHGNTFWSRLYLARHDWAGVAEDRTGVRVVIVSRPKGGREHPVNNYSTLSIIYSIAIINIYSLTSIAIVCRREIFIPEVTNRNSIILKYR